MILSFAILASTAGAVLFAEPCRILPERPYTQGQPFSYPLETAHGMMASGDRPLGFTFPAFGGPGCPELPVALIRYFDSTGEGASVLLLAGEEFRSRQGGPWSTEFGGIVAGRKGPASFCVDARAYTELSGNPGRPSFDREDMDEQSARATGSLDYRSYSRFRGDFTAETGLGRFSAGRDAAHWGPALYGNPVFSQSAVPFFQISYSGEWGPVKVTSLYGDLSIGASQGFAAENIESRSLFAHRYELPLGRSVLLGITEQIVLHDLAKPYLFVPVFPLFIAKGYLVEDRTNGGIAVDLSWRTPFSALLYAEFLLDDLESPSSLLTQDYVQNKWAAVAGAHWSLERGPVHWGAILEGSRVEPWVYAHFVPSTAQAAHAGHPLGNPSGADSRTAVAKGYARLARGLYFGLQGTLHWKGKGASSGIENPVPRDPLAPKVALEGEGSPDAFLEPEAALSFRHAFLRISGRIGDGAGLRASVLAHY